MCAAASKRPRADRRRRSPRPDASSPRCALRRRSPLRRSLRPPPCRAPRSRTIPTGVRRSTTSCASRTRLAHLAPRVARTAPSSTRTPSACSPPSRPSRGPRCPPRTPSRLPTPTSSPSSRCSRRARWPPRRSPRDCTRASARPCAGTAVANRGARGSASAPESRGDYLEFAACMLLADRNGPATLAQLEAFRKVVSEVAASLPAAFDGPAAADEAQRAEALDRLCAELDMQIGLTVRKVVPATIAGTRLRGVAEASGFRLAPTGRFEWVQDETGAVLFTLQNLTDEAFTPESLRQGATPGVVFLLDVPRVSEPGKAFDQMKLAAKRMAQTRRWRARRRQWPAAQRQRTRGHPRAGDDGRRRAAADEHRAGEPARPQAVHGLTAWTARHGPLPSRRRRWPSARRRCARRSRATTTPTTCSTRRRSPMPSTTRSSASWRTLEARASRAGHARFAHAARRRPAAGRVRAGAPSRADAVDPHRDRHHGGRRGEVRRARSGATSGSPRMRRRSTTWPSSSSTASRSACATSRACSRSRRRAATARSART